MRHIFVPVLVALGIGLQAPAPAAIVERAVSGGFSGVVLAVRDGETVLERAAGTLNDEAGTPFTTTTPFSIASVTKQFTRAAMLLLEQQGRLSMSDPVSKHIPELPSDKAGITLQHLFDMQAGLHEYHDVDGAVPGDHQPMTREEAIRAIGAQRVHFAPGAGRLYSNSSYTLLAVVIERVSGKAYDAFVREALLAPAGMTDTGFYGEARWRGRASRGAGPSRYRDNDPAAWPAPAWTIAGSGGMVSTAGDLAKWIRAMHAGRIIGPDRMRRMYPRAEWASYAGGSSFGNYTNVVEFDEGRDFVILHSNKGPGFGALAGEIAEAMRGAPLPDALEEALGGRRTAGPGAPPQAGDGITRLPGGPDTPAKRAARALLAALGDGTEAALTAFVNDMMAAGMRSAFPMPAHLEQLGRIGSAVQGAARIRIVPDGEHAASIVLEGGERTVVKLNVSPEAPHLLEGIVIER